MCFSESGSTPAGVTATAKTYGGSAKVQTLELSPCRSKPIRTCVVLVRNSCTLCNAMPRTTQTGQSLEIEALTIKVDVRVVTVVKRTILVLVPTVIVVNSNSSYRRL